MGFYGVIPHEFVNLVFGAFILVIIYLGLFISERTGKVGGKVRIKKDETEKVTTSFLTIGTVASMMKPFYLQYVIGAMSDAAKRTPFVCQGLYRTVHEMA